MQIPNLREIRELHGLTQKELADVSGVSLRSVAGYEGGAHARPNTARKLAHALNVEVADLAGAPSSPKAQAPPSSIQPPLNGFEEERRIAINYDACRTALESFCDHWQPALSGKRRLNRQGFEDFKAGAASLSRLTRELMGAEMTTLGQQYDEEGDPVSYTERSEFGPAVMRFHDLAIRMGEIGKESFDEDLTSDPEMGQLLELFPKAS